jgi:hypothetical protein
VAMLCITCYMIVISSWPPWTLFMAVTLCVSQIDHKLWKTHFNFSRSGGNLPPDLEKLKWVLSIY